MYTEDLKRKYQPNEEELEKIRKLISFMRQSSNEKILEFFKQRKDVGKLILKYQMTDEEDRVYLREKLQEIHGPRKMAQYKASKVIEIVESENRCMHTFKLSNDDIERRRIRETGLYRDGKQIDKVMTIGLRFCGEKFHERSGGTVNIIESLNPEFYKEIKETYQTLSGY